MRVLMIAESPPSVDPSTGDGSTLISAHVLRHLPAEVEVDLVYFGGGPADPPALAATRSVRALAKRPRRRAVLAQPLTRLPRGNWQRHAPTRLLREWAQQADVVYAHGLHVLHLALILPLPLVVHEVDPWSQYWAQRAAAAHGPRRWYDREQSRRASRLERAAADAGATLVVVNDRDAESLRRATGGHVAAVANGVEPPQTSTQDVPTEPVLAFVGTLDYPPNLEALRRLVTDIWPQVRTAVPSARMVLAGRNAGPAVFAMAGEGIEVVGEVGDVGTVFRSARASLYPGVTGRGTKNSVTESLVAGCPVVASTESARGQRPGRHLLIGDDAAELAAHAIRLLTDVTAAGEARTACAVVREQARSWSQAAEEMATLLREARR